MAQRGGRRAGAGRKLDAETEDWRQFLRGYFNSPAGRQETLQRMKASDVIYARAMSLVFPTPHEIRGDIDVTAHGGLFQSQLSNGAPVNRPLAPSPAKGKK